jgi:hypothetical protein
MAKRNTVTLVLALMAMASLSAAVFFGAMEIQAKRLGSWGAAMAYPRPIMVLSENTKPRGAN